MKLSPEDIAEGKRQLSHLCKRLGCSMLTLACPGDPRCDILQKVARSEWAARVIKEEEIIFHAKENNLMTPDEYQKLASRTLIEKPDSEYSDFQLMMVWNAVGLAGEAGEVADHIKKGVFHQHGIDQGKLEKELGDVLWYVAALCTTAGLLLEDVMRLNIEKLKKRYPNGFSSEDSKRRIDVSQSA